MRALVALVSGSLFGLGLIISDMANPARAQAFFDLFGAWDPTLAFVMGGAVTPMLFAWRIANGRAPRYGGSFPGLRQQIDARLIGGAVMFGVGWGLAGFCPGPMLATLSFAGGDVYVILTAMLVGMAAHHFAPPARMPLVRRTRAA